MADEEKLAAREAAVKRKEKECAQRLADLDRRKAAVDETEEKHGALAIREAAADAKDKELAAQIKEAKKREKAAKEAEARATESQEALDKAEERATVRENELTALKKALDERKVTLDKLQTELEAKDQALRARNAQLQDIAIEQENARTRLTRETERAKERDEEIARAAAAVTLREREAQRRHEQAERKDVALHSKTAAVVQQEADLNKKREHIGHMQKQFEIEERMMVTKRHELQSQTAECERRVSIAEAQEANARRAREEAEAALNALSHARDVLDRRASDLESREDDVRQTVASCRISEEETARRELALENERKEIRSRERALQIRQDALEQQQTAIERQKSELSDREDAVLRRERAVTEREHAMDVLKRQCQSDAAATQRRNEELDVRERDIVSWMKEMQWREMILGEDEELVGRQPVAPIVRPTRRSTGDFAAGGKNSKTSFGMSMLGQSAALALSSTFGASMLGDGNTQLPPASAPGRSNPSRQPSPQRSSVPFSGTASVGGDGEVPPHTHAAAAGAPGGDANPAADLAAFAALITDAYPEGYGHRAYGHAIVSVQFRRLKDQYVSAQMKHAREEISGEKGNRAQHRLTERRKARHGLKAASSTGDLLQEAQEQGTIAQLTDAVHRMSLHFVRTMAKLRAFDGYESPTSPEKLSQLDEFSAAEQATLTMAANLEYLIRSVQGFLAGLMRSPLDDKDAATDVQDLVNKTSAWWERTRQRAIDTLLQLLCDRRQYLTQGLAVLAVHNVASRFRGGAGLASATAAAAATRPQTPSAAGLSREAADADPASLPEWSTSAVMVPDDDVKGAHRGTGSSNSKQPSDDAPYTAVSVFDHVSESKLLAPRGLATLKAASDANGGSRSSSAPTHQQQSSDGAIGKSKPLAKSAMTTSATTVPAAAAATAGDSASATRPATAAGQQRPTLIRPATAGPSLAALHHPTAGVFRTDVQTRADTCFLDLGRGFHRPPSAAPSSNAATTVPARVSGSTTPPRTPEAKHHHHHHSASRGESPQPSPGLRPPSKFNARNFNLNEFLTSPDTKPKLQHSSPYAVPPVRPSSASPATPAEKHHLMRRKGAAGAGGIHDDGASHNHQGASAAQGNSQSLQSPLGKRRGLPPRP